MPASLVPLQRYLPALSMVLVTVLASFAQALADNTVTAVEMVQLLILGVGAVTTYIVPRLQDATLAKPVVAFLFAGLTALYGLLNQGESMTLANWIVVALAAFGAIGVTVTNRYVPITPPDRGA